MEPSIECSYCFQLGHSSTFCHVLQSKPLLTFAPRRPKRSDSPVMNRNKEKPGPLLIDIPEDVNFPTHSEVPHLPHISSSRGRRLTYTSSLFNKNK